MEQKNAGSSAIFVFDVHDLTIQAGGWELLQAGEIILRGQPVEIV